MGSIKLEYSDLIKEKYIDSVNEYNKENTPCEVYIFNGLYKVFWESAPTYYGGM